MFILCYRFRNFLHLKRANTANFPAFLRCGFSKQRHDFDSTVPSRHYTGYPQAVAIHLPSPGQISTKHLKTSIKPFFVTCRLPQYPEFWRCVETGTLFWGRTGNDSWKVSIICWQWQHPTPNCYTDLANCRCHLKGTVSRDFLLLVFFMNQFPPNPRVSH